MNPTPTASGSDIPLRLGTPEEFRLVAAALRSPGFEERAVYQTLEKGGFSSMGLESFEGEGDLTLNPSVFMRIFVKLEAIPRTELDHIIDTATLEAFLALDLIRVSESNTPEYYSPVFLYPLGDLLLASDHHNTALDSDSVFPAIQTSTLRFLKLLPLSAASDGLDLGSGTGVCAFILSRSVQRVAASDITARSTHFARFNALLNDCINVEAVQGDLYGGVEGKTFDRIVAHPPYVPNPDGAETWRDGGLTGEALTKRIVEGLPRYLRQGGSYFSFCSGAEKDGLPFEERARSWLGDRQGEFDIVFASHQHLSPMEVARQLASRGKPQAGRAEAFESAFHKAGVSRFSLGALVIRRHEDAGAKTWTIRTKLTARADGASFEAMFDRMLRCSVPSAIAGLRPRLASTLSATLGYGVDQSGFVPNEFAIETNGPFVHLTKTDPWVFPLIARFDGKTKVSAVFEQAHAEEALPAEVPFETFATFAGMMIVHGYFEISDLD